MRKKGIALIVVLVLVVLFSALILAVVLSATTAIRKGYWFETYPGDSGKIYFRGSDYTGTETWYDTPPSPSNPYYQPVKGLTKPNFCKLEFEDRNEIDKDEIISTGYYNGKKATIRVKVRGNNGYGNPEHTERYLGNYQWNGSGWDDLKATWGVAEAFNKHVIYSKILDYSDGTINGNITCETCLNENISGKATLTKQTGWLDCCKPGDWKPEAPEDSEPTKPTPAWDKKFKDDDGAAPYVSYDSTQYETTLPPGVSYSEDGTTETYTIDVVDTISENWIFEKADSADILIVKITGNTSLPSGYTIKAGKDGTSPTEDADIVLDFSDPNNPDIKGKLVAEGDIKIENVDVANPHQIGTSGGTTLWAGNEIIIDYTSGEGPEINGDIRGNEINLKCGGNKIIINGNVYGADKVNFLDNANTTDGITVNGDVIGIGGITFDSNNGGKNTVYSLVTKLVTKSDLTIPNNTHFSLVIDSTNSERKAGIIIYQDGDAILNLTINSDLNITVGDNQVGGIIVYFDNVSQTETGKVSNITISGGINFTDSENNKFLLINHSEDGSITIDASGKEVNGSIYSYYGATTPSITVNNGTLNGSIITNGTVNLNGGSIIYNPIPYKNSTGDIYKGFVGGRRVYLPVPGSWRVEW